MFKYRTIVKVLLLGMKGEKIISHLLLTNSNDFQVDLSGDFLFNELPVLSVLTETSVNSLDDVFKYCKDKNIIIPIGRKYKEGLLVGGEKEFLINHDLEGNWIFTNNSLFDDMADFIIKYVQDNSIISGFQCNVSFDVVEEEFGINLEPDYTICLLELLSEREEVADADFYLDSFDVTLYTAFAPNYCEELEEISF